MMKIMMNAKTLSYGQNFLAFMILKNMISFGLLYRVHEESASNKKSKILSIYKKKNYRKEF